MTSFDPPDTCAPNHESSGLDAETFGFFVATHQNRIFRFILKSVTCIATAEELTQETFLAAYRSIYRFRGESRLSTWLTGIALNLVRNHLNRSDEKRKDSVSEEWLLSRIAEKDDPHRNYERKEFLTRLHDEISSLPAEQREALILVSMEDLSYGEAAEVLNISEGTVKSRVYRARERMRERMKELFPR